VTAITEIPEWRKRRIERFHSLGAKKYIVCYMVLPMSGGMALVTAFLLLSEPVAAITKFLMVAGVAALFAVFWRVRGLEDVAL
jgi:hypothetical protein